MREAFSVREAAEMLGCCRETVRRAIRCGQLRACRVGTDFRISRAELRAYWESRGGWKLFEEDEKCLSG